MDFLELADELEGRARRSAEAESSGSSGASTGGSGGENDAPRMVHQSFAEMAIAARDLELTRDQERASIIAILGEAYESEKIAINLPDDGDGEETDEDRKRPLGERLVRWFLKHLIKKVAKTGVRVILESLWSLIRWFAEDVIVGGLRVAGEFILRNLIVDGIGFVMVNPELWIPLAAIGAAGLGYWIYRRFFNDNEPFDISVKDRTKPTTEYSETNILPSRDYQPSSAGAGQRPGISPPPEGQAPAPPQPGTPLESYVKPMIVRHEGRRNEPYRDSLGLWTVGIGHLIGDGSVLPESWKRTFSDAEIDALFSQDYAVHAGAAMTIPNFDKLNEQGQAALIDITFNMGTAWWKPHGRSRGFPRFTQAMKDMDIATAVTSLAESKWATQVGRRSQEDLALLGTNVVAPSPDMKPSTTISGTSATKTNAPASPQAPAGGPGQTSAGGSTVKDSQLIKGPKGVPMKIN